MRKIARIVSMEFDSNQSKVESLAKFRSNINDLAAGIELSVVINTDENTMMAIQIWPHEAIAHAFDERMKAWSEQNF